MVNGEITLEGAPAKPLWIISGPRLIALSLGFLTGASILLLVYQENRAVQYRMEATEVWSASQFKIVQATTEEDPNLKKQYAEEQEALRQRAQDLKQRSSDAARSVTVSTYSVLLLLVGAAIAVSARS